MKMLIRLAVTVFLTGFFMHTSPVSAQSGEPKPASPAVTRAFTLQQAQDYAFENNYDLKNAYNDVEIARKMVKQNTAIGLPQVNASLDYMDYIEMPTSLIPGEFFGKPGEMIPVQFGTKYNASFDATITQLVYSGQYLVGLQTARAYLETEKTKSLKTKVDVRDIVADAYIRLLVIDKAILILDSTYKIVSTMVDELKAMNQNGMIEDVDVDQASLDKSNLEARITDTRSGRNVAYSSLKFLIGLKDNEEMTLTDDLDFFLAQINREMLVNQPFDYNFNLDYVLLKKAAYMTKMQFKLSKTAYQPTLAGFFNYSQTAQRNEWNFFDSGEPWFNTINWGLSLRIPIWSSGSRKYAVDQARINVDKMKVRDDQLKQALQLQVETAKKDFSNSWFVYENLRKGFETSLKIYQKTTIKYKQGLASSTDLNQKYQQFLTANGNYMQSTYELLRTKIKLTRLLEQF
jgi:outer membrane protein TolC